MKTKFLIIILALFLFSSCKKTEVSGIVYSKHNIPISNVEVKVYYTLGSVNNPEGTITTTDNNGHYYLDFKTKRERSYTVRCECDSGKVWEPVKEKHSNSIDLHLN